MKLIRKIKKKLPAIKLQTRYWLQNKFSNEHVTSTNSTETHVSVTSYGTRIKSLYLTLESICAQSVKPTTVTVYLSTEDINENELPNSLLRLKKRGVELVFVKENIRSFKKLYYSYEKHAADEAGKLITIDDDVYYHESWLAGLLEASEQHQNNVICYRGHHLALNEDGTIKSADEWVLGNHKRSDVPDDRILMPTGIAGVLYPIESLKGLNTQKEDFMSLCGYADDIWFKCLTLSNGFNAILVKSPQNANPIPRLTLNINRRGLAVYNVYQGGNDKQMKATIQYFKINFLN
jgi:hypothetical protein